MQLKAEGFGRESGMKLKKAVGRFITSRLPSVLLNVRGLLLNADYLPLAADCFLPAPQSFIGLRRSRDDCRRPEVP